MKTEASLSFYAKDASTLNESSLVSLADEIVKGCDVAVLDGFSDKLGEFTFCSSFHHILQSFGIGVAVRGHTD